MYLGLLDLPRLWRLCQGGIRVDATVVGTPCAGGTRRFSYRFDADARTLTGVGRVSELGLDCSTLAAGVVVPVYYLSADHTVSDVTPDPRRSLRRRAIIVAGFGLAALLSVAGVFVAFNASRRSRNA